MAQAYVRNQTSGLIICVDQIAAITAIINPDNTYSYQLFLVGNLQQPVYTSPSTYPDPIAAVQFAYNQFVIELV